MAERGEELPGDFDPMDPDPDDVILIPMASTSHYDPYGHLTMDETSFGDDELTPLIPTGREKYTT